MFRKLCRCRIYESTLHHSRKFGDQTLVLWNARLHYKTKFLFYSIYIWDQRNTNTFRVFYSTIDSFVSLHMLIAHDLYHKEKYSERYHSKCRKKSFDYIRIHIQNLYDNEYESTRIKYRYSQSKCKTKLYS